MPQIFRAVAYVPPAEAGTAFDLAVLPHDERRVRRRLITLVHGDQVLVDFPQPVAPTIAIDAPGRTSRSNPSRTGRSTS